MNQPLKKSDLVVVSKEEAFWHRALGITEQQVKEHSDILKFQKQVLAMVKEKIKEAKQKT